MLVRDIMAEQILIKKPFRKPVLDSDSNFVDKQGRSIIFKSDKRGKHYPEDPDTTGSVYAFFEGKEIAYVSLSIPRRFQFDVPHQSSSWVVQRTMVQPDFRRSGIGYALYDFAFREGFRPLTGNQIQTDGGKGLWRNHVQAKSASHGDFYSADHPNRLHWWPLNLPVPSDKKRR